MLRSHNKVFRSAVGHGLPSVVLQEETKVDGFTGIESKKKVTKYLRDPKRIPARTFTLLEQLKNGEPLKKVSTIMKSPSHEEILNLASELEIELQNSVSPTLQEDPSNVKPQND